MKDLPTYFGPMSQRASCDKKSRKCNLEIELPDRDLLWQGSVTAWAGGRRAGGCHFQHLKAISDRFHVGLGQISMGADASFHGSGVAQALLTYAHKRLYSRGVRKMMLATNQGLFRAIRFYEKLGYSAQPIKSYSFSKEL